MYYNKYQSKSTHFNSKKVILFCIIAIVIVIGVMSLFVLLKGNDKKSEISTIFDTTLLGDASIDPENKEMTDEEGVNVKASDVSVEKGRSHGIDVSQWQGKIDWEKVKNSNIDFAFIRIGYRGDNGILYKDEHADYNIQQAQKAGVLVGVYFFSTALNESEAMEEAQWTLQAIEGYKISYPVVYDCEGYKNIDSRTYHLTAQERTNNALAFLKTIAAQDYDTMFYGSLNDIQNTHYWNLSQIETKYKIWIAQYASVSYPQKDKPDYNGQCQAWQYTNKGSVNGISGNVDMVVCYFVNEEATVKNKKATPATAAAPLTEEEKKYTSVNEKVTAKDLTNLRKAATTKSDIVVALKNGETVTRIGIGTNGWSQLKYNNQIVYAISSYLTTDLSYQSTSVESVQEDVVAGNTFEAKKDKVTAKDVVNLRSLPTTDSDIVGTLESGDFLERTAISNKGWSRLIYKGQTVYAVTSYLSHEVVAQPETPTVSQSDGFAIVNEQVTAKDETNLRSYPSTTDSEIVYTLKHGEYVKRIGIHSNGWSKLDYNGQIVYAISSYLTNE